MPSNTRPPSEYDSLAKIEFLRGQASSQNPYRHCPRVFVDFRLRRNGAASEAAFRFLKLDSSGTDDREYAEGDISPLTSREARRDCGQ